MPAEPWPAGHTAQALGPCDGQNQTQAWGCRQGPGPSGRAGTHADMHTHVHTHALTHKCTHIHTRAHIHMHAYTHTHVLSRARSHPHMHTFRHSHMHVHSRTRMLTLTCVHTLPTCHPHLTDPGSPEPALWECGEADRLHTEWGDNTTRCWQRHSRGCHKKTQGRSSGTTHPSLSATDHHRGATAPSPCSQRARSQSSGATTCQPVRQKKACTLGQDVAPSSGLAISFR